MLAPVPRRRLLAALACLAIAACSSPQLHPVVPRGATVVALGDSLTWGTGASRDASYPAFLAERTGWRVENAGVPGETASQICARLPDLLGEHRPALVIVLAGGNDFLRRLPESGVRHALGECASHARAVAVPLVLVPVPRFGVGGLAVAPLYGETAEALGVPLADAGLADLLRSPSMRADAVHLNADGYRALADRLAERLTTLGFLR